MTNPRLRDYVQERLAGNVTRPQGDAGDDARAVVPRTLRQIQDRLCTVGRTVTLGEPVAYVEAQPGFGGP